MVFEFLLKMFIIGMTIFGGGPVFIPMMRSTLVFDLGIFTAEKFDLLIGIVTALPGPLGPKIAGYAAYLQFGLIGFVYVFISLVLPGAILMLIAYRYVDKMKKSDIMKNITKFIKPICVGIFISIAYTFAIKGFDSSSIFTLYNGLMLVLFIGSYVLLTRFKIEVMYLYIFALILGVILTTF